MVNGLYLYSVLTNLEDPNEPEKFCHSRLCSHTDCGTLRCSHSCLGSVWRAPASLDPLTSTSMQDVKWHNNWHRQLLPLSSSSSPQIVWHSQSLWRKTNGAPRLVALQCQLALRLCILATQAAISFQYFRCRYLTNIMAQVIFLCLF